MYRQTDGRKVWYEWMVEVFALERYTGASSREFVAPVMSGARAVSPGGNGAQNAKPPQLKGGHDRIRRVRVGMTDLHSSIKEGCLM